MSGSTKLNWALLLAVSWGLRPELEPGARSDEAQFQWFCRGWCRPCLMRALPPIRCSQVVPRCSCHPPGRSARGYAPLHFEVTPEEAERAGRELENPFSADDVLALGAGREGVRDLLPALSR